MNPRFWALFATQFLGAFNDNVFKNALVMMITFKSVSIMGLDQGSVVALAGGIFILPFFLFSPLAGQIADKTERARLARLTKYWELIIMIVGAVGFLTKQFEFLLLVLFLMGAQSTLFGPVKYSILPDLVPRHQLLKANAYVEMGTFLAILLGTLLGGLLVHWPQSEIWTSVVVIAIAGLGVFTSLRIPQVPVASPDLHIQVNPLPSFAQLFRILIRHSTVFHSTLGISWFWFFGAAVLSLLPVFCKDELSVDEGVVTAFLAMFTLGIGLGSMIGEKLSKGKIRLFLVPVGGLGMSIFLFDLAFLPWAGLSSTNALQDLPTFLATNFGGRMLLDFLAMSVCGGIFILPLYTLLQERSDGRERSRVIAANNISNALFMVVASVMLMVMHALNVTYQNMFLILAAMNLAAVGHMLYHVPETRKP